MWLLFFACSSGSPAVSGVEPEPEAVAKVAEARQRKQFLASPSAVAAAYVKAESVYVDIRFLGGRNYGLIRGEVEDQLGPLAEQRPLAPDQGAEYTFERGTLHVLNERIIMVEVPLPQPLRRSAALLATGFPDQVSTQWDALSGEYRVYNAWGFRRLRFFRAAPGSEDIVRIQAWKGAE